MVVKHPVHSPVHESTVQVLKYPDQCTICRHWWPHYKLLSISPSHMHSSVSQKQCNSGQTLPSPRWWCNTSRAGEGVVWFTRLTLRYIWHANHDPTDLNFKKLYVLHCQARSSLWLKHWCLSLSRSRVGLRLHLRDWGIQCVHYVDDLLPHAPL